ncbi:hypothetical protein BJX64DRAFT_298780 [Aspergillus heterothallicus]
MAYLNGARLSPDANRKWVEARTGETVSFENLYSIELPWANTSRIYDNSDICSDIKLPSRSVIEGHSFLSLANGFVWRHSISPTDQEKASAQVTLFGLGDRLHEVVDCGSYAVAAQNLIPRITQKMTPSGLEALVMLVISRHGVSASTATRLLYKFDAHISPTASPLEHPYYYDKNLCLRTGQPPSIIDSSCDLTLPSDHAKMQDANIQQSTMSIDDHTLPLYPFDLRLSQIKFEVYQSLYSAGTWKKPDTEMLSIIRNLDQTLEQWRISLHPDFRPMLWFTQEMRVNANLNTQAVMLRLAYHHCFTMIHQASERINLTINASWSTLSYLKVAIPALKAHVFWLVIFYAITGVLTLFHTVLKNPLHPWASSHVRMLRDFPDLIRSIPIHTLTLGEVIHLKFLDGFTADLARLGKCAIPKAQRDLPVPYAPH